MIEIRLPLLSAVMLLIISAAGCSWFGGGDAVSSSAASSAAAERIPTSIIRQFVRVAVDIDGTVKWRLKAREARFFADTGEVFMTDFILYMYRNGTPVSTLRARRGKLFNSSSRVTAMRLVYLRSETGRILRTELLHADNRQKIVYNDVFNRITMEDGTVLLGYDLWAHNDLKVFKLKNTRGQAPAGTWQNNAAPDAAGKGGP